MNPKKPFKVIQNLDIGRKKFSVIDYFDSLGNRLKREYRIGKKEVEETVFFDELFIRLVNAGLLNAKRIVKEVEV